MSVSIYVGSESQVNLSNANFSLMCQLLGLTHDYCGEFDPLELLKAVEAAEKRLECGRGPEFTRSTEREGNHISFGADEGYLKMRLGEFMGIAEKAIKTREKISFC